jgi:hypothetical protein
MPIPCHDPDSQVVNSDMIARDTMTMSAEDIAVMGPIKQMRALRWRAIS